MANSEIQPLVSCIMPTCNRRAFVPHAVRYFLAQHYHNKELLIVDDGSDCIEDIVPDHEQIRYIRLSQGMTLGEKRNFCVQQSKADLIMHWDDDDWMATRRISYQVQEMIKHNAEVCGLKQMYFYQPATKQAWLYNYPDYAQAWLAGNSLLYTRDFWKAYPFPHIQVASDTPFILKRKMNAYVALEDASFYVATVHEKNTSPKQTNSSLWHPIDATRVQEIMKKDSSVYNLAENSNTLAKEVHGTVSRAPNPGSVSACLLSCKRPGNMQKIIDQIQHYPFISEIIVWNNDAGCSLDLHGDKVRVINSTENTICYGRFLCAAEAVNDIVYFQDDDAIVSNVPELYQAFLADSSRITHALSPQHFKMRDKYYYHSGHVALLGWGSFIQKKWLSVLADYLQHNDNDYMFRREADKIFSLLLRTSSNTLPAQITLLEHDSTSGIALYLESDHTLYVALAIRKALEYNRRLGGLFPPVWNIVITCMNYGHYLEEAVRSVLYNHADYIITIVDDASTDNTAEVARRLVRQYPFINYLRNEKQMGTGYSRNVGTAASDSVFVVLLDADDKIGPEYLFEAEKLLRKGNDVVNPDAILFGEVVSRWPVPETVTLSMQLQRNNVHCCSAFRRSYWAQAGGVDESMLIWEDYEFWIRLAAAGARIKKIPGNHFYYRKHGASRSGRAAEEKSDAAYIRSKHSGLFT